MENQNEYTAEIVGIKQKGNVYLRYQVVVNRTPFRKTTGVSVPEHEWDGKRIIKGSPAYHSYEELNQTLRNINKHLHDLYRQRIPVTRQNWSEVNHLNPDGSVKGSKLELYSFVNDLILNNQGRLSKLTIKKYITNLRRLQEYYQEPELYYEDVVDVEFLEDIREYFIHTKNFSYNTVVGFFSVLKAWNNRALLLDLTTYYPFKKFKIGTYTSTPRFLEIEDLRKLIKSYNEEQHKYAPHLLNTFRAFLFSVNTGISYADLHRFDKRLHYANGRIQMTRQKTGQPVNVPVNRAALRYLSEIDSSFEMITNQKTNVNLKDIAKIAELDDRIYLTFHMARHTFATTSLTMGVDLKTISNILGHSSVTTTEIYARIVDEKRKEAVNKLDFI